MGELALAIVGIPICGASFLGSDSSFRDTGLGVLLALTGLRIAAFVIGTSSRLTS